MVAKAASNESIDGCMTACKKADGRQHNNQPNKGVVKVSGGGGGNCNSEGSGDDGDNVGGEGARDGEADRDAVPQTHRRRPRPACLTSTTPGLPTMGCLCWGNPLAIGVLDAAADEIPNLCDGPGDLLKRYSMELALGVVHRMERGKEGHWVNRIRPHTISKI